MESLGVTSKLGAGAAYNAFLLIGAVLGLLVIDRISRRTFLIGTFFLGAALLMALVLLADVSPVLAVSLFASFALVLAAAVNLEFVYPPELFPTDLRASGVGIATAASRIGSAASTFLLPIVVGHLQHQRGARRVRRRPGHRWPHLLGLGPRNRYRVAGRGRRTGAAGIR